ncbi:hypothetical protein L2E82_52537 [Cichorium intybus]|nr:hypothetical protein L2E82_52537 [Cichorium intybus]
MNRKPGYGAKLRANLEPTKGVGRLRQQDGGHGRGRGGSLQNLGREPGAGAAVGADLGGSSKYSNENFEGRKRRKACPPWGNDSVGGRVQRLEEHRTSRGVRCAPGGPLKIRRTECLPRPVVLITASGLQGEQPLVDGTIPEPVGCRRTARAASAARAGSPRAGRGTDWERLLRGPSPGVEQPTQNCGAMPLFWTQGLPRQADPGGRRHCQVGSLAGAAHLLKDNAESGLEATRVPAACLPTSSRGLGPQRHVSLAKPVRRMSRAGRHEVQFPSSGG